MREYVIWCTVGVLSLSVHLFLHLFLSTCSSLPWNKKLLKGIFISCSICKCTGMNLSHYQQTVFLFLLFLLLLKYHNVITHIPSTQLFFIEWKGAYAYHGSLEKCTCFKNRANSCCLRYWFSLKWAIVKFECFCQQHWHHTKLWMLR